MSRSRTLLILITGVLIGTLFAPIAAFSAGTDTASGIAVVKATKRCKKVDTGINVTANTKVAATVLTDVGGIAVQRVVRKKADDQLRICLSGVAPEPIEVSWIAHNGSALAHIGHLHDGRYYTEAETDAKLATKVDKADLVHEPGVAYSYDKAGAIVKDTDLFVREMVSTQIRVPADGYVAIEATGNWSGGTAGDDAAACQLQKGAATGFSVAGDEPWFRLSEGASGQDELTLFSAHRVMPIFAADNPVGVRAGQTIMLVCDGEDGSIEASQLHISATYFPTKYDKTRTPTPGPIVP